MTRTGGFLATFLACSMLFGAEGRAQQPMTADELVALSRAYSSYVDASKPDRTGDRSAVSPDGSMRLDSYLHGQALVLSTPDGNIVAEAIPVVPVTHVLFSTDGHPVTVGRDNVISIWPANFDGAPKTVAIEGYEALNTMPRVTIATPLWVGTSNLAVGGWRGARGLYDIASGKKLSDLMFDTKSIESILPSPDGRMFATVQGAAITVYRASDCAFLGHYDWMEGFNDTGSEQIWDAAFSSDGREIHVTHWGGGWREMEIESNRIGDYRSISDTRKFALAPDDQRLAAFLATNDHPLLQEVQVFNRDKAAMKAPGPDGCGGEHATPVYSSAGVNLELRSCMVPVTLPHPDGLDPLWEAYPIDFAFSPDGSYLAAVTGGNDVERNRLIIWDVAKGRAIMDYLLDRPPTEFDDMHGIVPVFSPDGAYVSVAFPDLHAISLPASGQVLRVKASEAGLIRKEDEN